MNSLEDPASAEAIERLSRFRRGFYQSLTRRADALFELAEAVLCADGPVKTLVDLSLAPEHRRGHGALYDGLNRGRLDVARFRAALAGLRLPRAVDGRIVLAVDVSPWLRPDACTSPDLHHTTTTQTTRYGTAVASSWDRLHPRLTHRAAWLDHEGALPIIEGTVIRLQVDQLPGGGDPNPVWLWWSGTGATPADIDRLWQAFLRRFDLEHTIRFCKQTL